MKRCKYCGAEVPKNVKFCSDCGKKLKSPTWLIVVTIILGIVILAFIFGDDTETQTVREEKFSYEVTNSYKDEYGFAYYIEGTVTNKANKNYSYVQIEFICYDKSGNNLGTALDNTNNLLAKQTWKFKAMSLFSDAKNVDHCDYHEITGW